MNFDISEEQQLLQDTVRKFLESECPPNQLRKIFDSDLELARKWHLRHFVEMIDNIADHSEDVADRLAIYTIKRTV